MAELEHVQEFVEQALEEQGVSMKIQMQISKMCIRDSGYPVSAF